MLLLAQTIILLLTGGVVVWYTIETSKIRRATSDQASLLAQQLSMLRAQVERDEARLRQSAQPAFRYSGGSQSSAVSRFQFTNYGTAPIRDIVVSSIDHRVHGHPSNYLAPGEALRVTVPELPRPMPRFEFSIEYSDQLGARNRLIATHTGDEKFEFSPAPV